jgi:hypothetical protein
VRCYTVRPLHTDGGETYHQIVRIADSGAWTVIETHARRATADSACRRLNAWARRRAERDGAVTR